MGLDHPDAPTWRNEIDQRLMSFLHPFMPAGGRVAEVGCGSGRLLARIGRERPVELIAVDYSVPSMTLVEQSECGFDPFSLRRPVSGLLSRPSI